MSRVIQTVFDLKVILFGMFPEEIIQKRNKHINLKKAPVIAFFFFFFYDFRRKKQTRAKERGMLIPLSQRIEYYAATKTSCGSDHEGKYVYET